MSKTRFLVVPLVMVIVVGLLVAGGWAIHRIGWTEGYAMATRTATGEVGAVPYAPSGLSYVALFLTAGLAFLLLMSFTGKLLGLWAFRTVAGPWMMAGGPWKAPPGRNAERWARRWHRHPHHMHPWCWGWDKAPSEGEEAQEAGTASAADSETPG